MVEKEPTSAIQSNYMTANWCNVNLKIYQSNSTVVSDSDPP